MDIVKMILEWFLGPISPQGLAFAMFVLQVGIFLFFFMNMVVLVIACAYNERSCRPNPLGSRRQPRLFFAYLFAGVFMALFGHVRSWKSNFKYPTRN